MKGEFLPVLQMEVDPQQLGTGSYFPASVSSAVCVCVFHVFVFKYVSI